jgi:hypothetical protein
MKVTTPKIVKDRWQHFKSQPENIKVKRKIKLNTVKYFMYSIFTVTHFYYELSEV